MQEKVDRKRGGKTILQSGQGWTLLAQLGLLKTGLRWKGIVVKSSMVPQRGIDKRPRGYYIYIMRYFSQVFSAQKSK